MNDPALAAFCAERGQGAGSRWYYASRFLPPAPRAAWRALQALARDLDPWLGPRRDPGVAAHRRRWWAEELEAFAAGRPRHPVTRGLAGRHAVVVPRVTALLAAAEAPVRRPDDWEEVRRRAAAYSDPLWSAATELAGGRAGEEVLALGRALRVADLVRHAPRLEAAGLPVLPPGLAAGQPEALRRAAAEAAAALGRALDGLAAAPLPAAEPLWLLGGMAQAELAELGRPGYHPASGILHLTPLRKLVIAWRRHRAWRRHLP